MVGLARVPPGGRGGRQTMIPSPLRTKHVERPSHCRRLGTHPSPRLGAFPSKWTPSSLVQQLERPLPDVGDAASYRDLGKPDAIPERLGLDAGDGRCRIDTPFRLSQEANARVPKLRDTVGDH